MITPVVVPLTPAQAHAMRRCSSLSYNPQRTSDSRVTYGAYLAEIRRIESARRIAR